ncbi:hypothetical protein Tco_0467857, partial [Tanacetum coccineum]
MKKSSTSSSNTQNLAFLSSENTNSTNEVSTINGDFGVSVVGGINHVPTTPCAQDIAYSFLAQPTTRHFARECRSGRNQGRRSFGDNGRSNASTNKSSSQALVAQDGLGGYDWSNDFEVEPVNYTFMAISSSSSSSSSDSENSFSVFDGRTSDEESTPTNDRSSKADRYKDVPTPITGNFLTPRADISFIGLDEYAIRNKIIESQTSELNTKTSETLGQTNNANTVKPNSASESVKSNTKINRDRVIIEDWTSDDEEEVFEVPVRTARPSISTARLVCTARPSISTARPSVSTSRPVYASRPIYPRMDNVRPRGSCLPNKRSYYTKPAFRPKDLKQDVKTFGVKNMTTAAGKGKVVTDLKKSRWVWKPKEEYLDHVSKDSGSFMLKKGNPEILLHDHAVVDSGFSSHMTGNKAYLSDYEDFNGGFVAFRSDLKG